MKKSKLLILVLVAPLLTGCGSGKVKAPKFAKEGESVSGDKFVEDIGKAYSSSAIAQEAALGSSVVSFNLKMSGDLGVERDKKSFSKSTSFTEQDTKLEYDAGNSILKMTNKGVMKESEKTKHGTTTSNGSQNQVASYGAAQVSGANYIVNVNQKAKEYFKIMLIEGEITAAKYDDMMLKMMVGSLIDQYSFSAAAWATMTDEEKAEYKFYENGNIYTYEFEHKVENEETKDEEDKVVKIESERHYTKVQIDFTAGKMAVKAFDEVENTTVYKQNSGIYVAEDIVKEKQLQSVDASCIDKDVKLKSTDLSKFKGLGF